MKAYQLTAQTGIDSLSLVTLPEPQVASDQVLVRVRAVSLNYRDIMIVDGRYGNFPLPVIPGSDAAGEIVAVGSEVTRWKKGDRVVSTFFQGWQTGPYPRTASSTALGASLQGVLAEYIVLSENGVLAIPSHLSFEEASTLPCAALTAWQALVTRANISADETVLVQGTGGVALFALQFAKLHGARVIITSSSDEKLARARALGADETINYRTKPNWDEEVMRLTDNAGADHIVEIGGKGTFPKSLQAIAAGGTISVVGGLSGGFTTEISLGDAIRNSVLIRGISVGSRGMAAAMHRAIEQNELLPVVDRVFPFEDLKAAYAHLESGAHFGKLVVTV